MTFSVLELLLLFAAGLQSAIRADTTTHPIPFDTTLAVASNARLSLDVGTGGAIRISGGESKTIGVHVSERVRHCAECVVTIVHTGAAVQIRIRRGTNAGAPADLRHLGAQVIGVREVGFQVQNGHGGDPRGS